MAERDAIDSANAPSSLGTGLMLPHLVLHDFLDAETVAGLLDFAAAHEADFYSTKVRSGRVNPAMRVSKGIRELGQYRALLKAKIINTLPMLVTRLRVNAVDEPGVELELVAHGDGAFYKRHIDTQTASERERIRVVSGVYYFHAQPKAFTGGALRLYAVGGAGDAFIDVAPQHNSLLVFPSWAPHEVMPVSCPSQRFTDSRFAINCWVYTKKPAAAA